MPPGTSFDAEEALLIRRILGGEKEQFYRLIKPYTRSVYLAAFATLRNEADAEEVAQETFLKAYRSLHSFRGEARFGTWLRSIAINEARMRARKDGRASTQSLSDLDGSEDDSAPYVPIQLSDWREWPSEVLENVEVRAAIARALAMLPPKHREILICRDVNEMSIAETAALLGISPVAVKVRLLRARLRIRDLLIEMLGVDPFAGRPPERGKNPWS